MKRLDEHQVIGLDMDKTLVDGPNSHHLRRYIERNPEKSYYVITFRHPEWAQECLPELRRHGLDTSLLRGVVGCPFILWASAELMAKLRLGESPAAVQRQAQQWGVPLSQIEKLSHKYVEWKGEVAKELGCTILVDDMAEMVMPGCTKHGICFLDTNSLIVDSDEALQETSRVTRFARLLRRR